MDVYSGKREVEQPKRSKKEIEAMRRIEARSFALTLIDEANALRAFELHPRIEAELRKAAMWIRYLNGDDTAVPQ